MKLQENMQEHIPYWPQIPKHQCRIVIVGNF